MRLRWIALCACLVLGLGIMRAEDDDLDIDPDLDLDQEPYEDDQDHDLRDYANLDGGVEQGEEEPVHVPPVSKAPSLPKVVYKRPTPIGDVHFAEAFDGDSLDGWVFSQAKKQDTDEDIAKYDGKWALREAADEKLVGDKGLVLESRAKHHAIAAFLNKPFHFLDKPLILQYEVNFQNGIECGGAYVKLLSSSPKLELTNFYDKTPYTIMFGPDKCGEDYKLHFIFRHKNPKTGELEEKHAKRPDADLKAYYTDKKPHLYTLIVRPDNSFEILVDGTSVNTGSLLEDMTPPINPPKEIEDPEDHKPEDWDERPKIPDDDAVKPDDWDEDAPAQIPDDTVVKPEGWLDEEPEYAPDPEAAKPDDWDEDMDGEWEAPQVPNPVCKNAPGCGTWNPPMISNPAYKGKWKQPLIDNPHYQGVWKPRKIQNPAYFEDQHPFRMTSFSALGLELWSMSSEILFDNFIICSDRSVADQWAADGWGLKQAAAAAEEPGIVGKLYQAADERPWLWAVYVFTVALPIVLLISFCWPNKKFVPSDGDAKKSDAVQPDDQKEGDKDEENDGEEDKDESNGARADEVDAKKSSESESGGVKGGAEHEGSQEDEDENEDEGEGEDADRTERKTAKSKSDLESEGEPQTQANDADGGKTSPRKRRLRKE